MIDKQTTQWFFRGFALTAVLILAALFLAQPTLGQNELRGNQEAQMIVAENSNDLTDDPQGRLFIPLQEENSDPLSNSNEEVNAAAGRTAQTAVGGGGGGGASNAYTSPLVVPAADFRSDGNDPTNLYFSFAGGYIAGTLAGTSCIAAPAYLPAGAVINSLQVTFYDNDGTHDIVVSLRRVDNYTGSQTTLGSASTSGASTAIVTPSTPIAANNTVSYPTYSYYLTTCLRSTDTRLYAAEIYYTQP